MENVTAPGAALTAKSAVTSTTTAPAAMVSPTVTVRMVPLPVMAQVEVLAAAARVVAQVPEAVSLQIALDAVIVM
jgi:hypothetical protein